MLLLTEPGHNISDNYIQKTRFRFLNRVSIKQHPVKDAANLNQ
jgi:hypothetical protein